MTMNRSWGYVPDDVQYKSAIEVVHTLCEVAGKGGNLLLNVSPTADGSLPQQQVERLEAVAGWMERSTDAIHDTEPALEPWQFYGPSTRRGDRVFLHCLWRPYEDVVIRGLPVKRVKQARHLASGTPLSFRTRTTADQDLMQSDPVGELFVALPPDLVDPVATVVELELSS